MPLSCTNLGVLRIEFITLLVIVGYDVFESYRKAVSLVYACVVLHVDTVADAYRVNICTEYCSILFYLHTHLIHDEAIDVGILFHLLR